MRKNAQEIVRFYNGIGRHVDAGAFYVDPALARLTVLGEFDAVTRVVEIGGGSGRYAASLLSAALPNDARYVDIEPSETMRELAYSRLAPWRDRVRILASDDFLTKDFEGWAERCIATYVVNVLPDAQTIQGLAQRAHGLLARGGMLCLVNQTHGASLLERVIGNAWMYGYAIVPNILGYCRLTDFAREHLDPELWLVHRRDVVCRWGFCSEVLTYRSALKASSH